MKWEDEGILIACLIIGIPLALTAGMLVLLLDSLRVGVPGWLLGFIPNGRAETNLTERM